MVLERLLVFTAFFLTAILPVSAQEKSSLYIDTLNEVDKILGEHHFFKNTTFENSDVIEELISNIDQQNLIFTNEEVDNYISLSKTNFDLGDEELLEIGFDILNDYKKRYKLFLPIKVNISMNLMKLIYLARKEFTEIERIKKDLILYR